MTRRVSSLEGMQYYNLPMDAIITADIAEMSRAKAGKGAPKGSSRQSRIGRAAPGKKPEAPLGKGADSGKAESKKVAPAGKTPPKAATPPVDAPPTRVSFKKEPSIAGKKKFSVAEVEYSAPEGSRVYDSPTGKDVAYVITPDGDVHVFGADGEVELDEITKAKVKSGLVDMADQLTEAKEAEAPKAESAPEAPKTEEPASVPETRIPATQPVRPRDPTSMGLSVSPPDEGEIDALEISPYSSLHIRTDGTFTPERSALHDQIIESFLEGLEAQESPIQYMNGGGPASGKGTMTKGRNAELTKYPTSRGVDDHTGDFKPFTGNPGALLIDPDAIKMQLPEVKLALERINAGDFEEEDTQWASHSHEESSQLAKRMHRAALERGYNIIYDGTGNGSVDSLRAKVAAARENGYRVEANYLFLDPQEGISRAAKRAAKSHRVVPDRQIRGTYAKLPGIVDATKDIGLFDSINLFDNNVPFGEPAKLIGHGDGKTFTKDDPEAYDRFMDSRNRTEAIQPDLQTTESSRAASAEGKA